MANKLPAAAQTLNQESSELSTDEEKATSQQRPTQPLNRDLEQQALSNAREADDGAGAGAVAKTSVFKSVGLLGPVPSSLNFAGNGRRYHFGKFCAKNQTNLAKEKLRWSVCAN